MHTHTRVEARTNTHMGHVEHKTRPSLENTSSDSPSNVRKDKNNP